MPIDRFNGLDVFVHVVEAGSFSAAARDLGATPSAMSKQISALEDRLGARLLNRTTRRLSLTETGEALFERARPALGALAEAEEAVVALNAAPRGRLRVNMPASFGEAHVAPVLPGFMQRYPDVSLEVTQTDRFVDLVAEGVDVAIRVAELKDSSLIARRLAPLRRLICAAPAYLAQHGTPAHPRELTGHNCLTFVERTHHIDWTFEEGGKRQTVTVAGTLQTNSVRTLVGAAVDGLGIANLSNYRIVEELKSGALVPLLEDYERPPSSVYAVYPASRHLSPTVRAFIDYLVETIGQPSFWTVAGLERSPVGTGTADS